MPGRASVPASIVLDVRSAWAPVPPLELPPARTLRVPDRGELFLRDTGGDGPAVMLLHGWMASADLNWCGAYGALADAGYRVLAIDHRGHGRGLRRSRRFASPTAPLTPPRRCERWTWRRRSSSATRWAARSPSWSPATTRTSSAALILSGTAQHWQDPPTRRVFKAVGALGLMLSVAPRATWAAGFRRVGLPESPATAWALSEMTRHCARDIAEAGRELGRFDSRPWLRPLPVPTAVVLTTRDDAVPPRKQHELAAALGAPVFEAPIKHLEVTSNGAVYNPVLLRALAAVGGREGAAVA